MYVTMVGENVPALARTSRETSAPQKTWSVHKTVPSKHVFTHISCTSFQIQMSPGKMLH